MTEPLILSESQIIGRGGHGRVFRVGQYAIKVFHRLSGREVGAIVSDPTEISDRRAVFGAERDGYLIASRTPQIRPHVPAFYGPVAVADVTGQGGESIASQFLLDCAYVMGYISGESQNLLPYDIPAHIQTFINEMNRVGIGRTDDMIVWNPGSPEQFILADFGTHDARLYAEYERMELPHPPVPTAPPPHGVIPSDLSNPFR